MPKNDTNHDRTPRIDRRRVLGAAAWAAPVIAVAVAAPAHATSTAQYRAHSGYDAKITFDFRSDDDHNPLPKSEIALDFEGDGLTPSATFSANSTGYTATIENYSATYTVPFAVNWTTTDPNWVVTPGPAADGLYSYTIAPAPGRLPKSVVMRTPYNDSEPSPVTEENSLPSPRMRGIADPTTYSFSVGERVVTLRIVKRFDFTAHLGGGVSVADAYSRDVSLRYTV